MLLGARQVVAIQPRTVQPHSDAMAHAIGDVLAVASAGVLPCLIGVLRAATTIAFRRPEGRCGGMPASRLGDIELGLDQRAHAIRRLTLPDRADGASFQQAEVLQPWQVLVEVEVEVFAQRGKRARRDRCVVDPGSLDKRPRVRAHPLDGLLIGHMTEKHRHQLLLVLLRWNLSALPRQRAPSLGGQNLDFSVTLARDQRQSPVEDARVAAQALAQLLPGAGVEIRKRSHRARLRGARSDFALAVLLAAQIQLLDRGGIERAQREHR